MDVHMRKIFILSLILGGCALFGGCVHQSPDDSQLPWNRPASWENRRDISTDLNFHKVYGPRNFYGNREASNLKVKIRDSETQIEVLRRENDDPMKSKIIRHEPNFFSENNKNFLLDATKSYPEQPKLYDFDGENSDFL
jgi:hypothetical protein